MKRALFIFSVILIPLSSFSDDPKLGRLPDGRAYRTDDSGTQLVDYIAELELSVDSLKRRANGLEDEVAEKQKVIERLSKGESVRGELAEKDLNSAEKMPAQAKEVSTSNAEIASLKNHIKDLETEIQNQNLALRSSSDSNARALGEKEKQLGEIKEELASFREDVEVDKQLHKKESDSLVEQISQLREDLGAKDKDLEKAKSQLAVANQEIERVSDERDRLVNVSAASRVEESSPRAPKQEESRASFSDAKVRALDSVRSALVTELNQLGSMLSTRDSLMRSYAAGDRAVMFRPTQAISSRGLKSDQLRKNVQQADSMVMLSQLKGDIGEIKLKLQDDIALLKRLSSSGR